MDQPGPSEHPLPPPPKENPVVAAAHKVKAALSSSSQRPSVGIYRGASSQQIARKPVPQPPAPEPVPKQENTFANRFRSLFSHKDEDNYSDEKSRQNEYDSETVDLLDVMDPEVATLSTLTNVQNSLFIPSMGKFCNRRPTYRIEDDEGEARTIDKLKASLRRLASLRDQEDEKADTKSALSDAQYAILPDGVTLAGWNKEEKAELDDMVRHQLHSKQAKFKRAMKGFSQYVRRLYATLITLFGAAWVFFLIGWISIGSKESYVVNIVDNVLVALFAIIEPGQVDVESLVARRMPRGAARRLAARIPKNIFASRNKTIDLPASALEYSVLTEEQQAKLDHHERKFSKSHTFYKPHETETHHAFPLKLLIVIVVLLDLHSCLQISLGACTWGTNYKTRPFALTTVILCCSITCNITGGVLISRGDKRTRKKDVIERMMRQELTSDAIDQMEKRWMKEAEERGDIDPAVRKRLEEEREQAENEEIKKSWKAVPILPKVLLGKGEDHRQPSLPQKARGSVPDISSTPSSSTPKEDKSRSSAALPSVQEDSKPLPRPQSALRGDEDPLKEGTGRKVMRFIRKADLDRS
ncbi:hypothetical protein LSUE1_G004718 [Lachnellula suecica]|uniref:Uncharacterized protein n=1 Tax=Lachnellula suecica TaxID=602035 RepID=A0A8T9C2X6_9HELO|nr:hypothetical protein LSUE1_G004718 [Lachnellula suecica]